MQGPHDHVDLKMQLSSQTQSQQDEKAVEFVNEDQRVPLLIVVDNISHLWKRIRPLAQVIGYISLAIRSSAASLTQVQRDSSGKTQGKAEVAEPSDSLASLSEYIIDVGHQTITTDQTVPLLATTDSSLHSWKLTRPLAQVIGCRTLANAASGTHVQCDSSGETQGEPEVPEASDSLASTSEHIIDMVHRTITTDQTVPLLAQVIGCKSLANATSETHGENQGKPEVPEASDSLASTSENRLGIGHQPITTDQHTKRKQIEKISMIVRQKNLQSLQAFGGVDGIVLALDTDLEKGISDEEYVHQQQEFYLSVAPTQYPFFHMIWEEVKKITAVLVFLAAALSIVFEIDEKGLENVGIYGVFVPVAIVLHVLITSVLKYRKQQMARKKLQEQQSVERNVKEVHVIRGGESKTVCESELVCGDIVFLKKGGQVPGDGLLVGDEDLKLGYGSQSYEINAEMPFLSYGGRIINKDAKMIVTFTKSMMSKATCERFKLERHLDKLNAWMNYVRLCISFLIVLVVFLRYKAGKIDDDDDDVYRPESMTEPSGIRSFSMTLEKIIIEQMYRFKALTMILGVSLLGLTEGVPFVVSLAIVYWNHKTPSGKATKQDLHGILKMASVTKICTDVFGELTEDDVEVQKLFIGGELVTEDKALPDIVAEALCERIGISKENVISHGAEYKVALSRERMEQMHHSNGTVKEIMSKCSYYYNIQGEQVPMNDTVRSNFGQANDNEDMETIAVACRPTDSQTQDWVLVGLLGLKNKDKEATKKQVKACRECGIEIILVSRKKIHVLKDIARQYGLTANDDPPESSVLTAEDLWKCTDEERKESVDTICILGEACSSDKLFLVETLRKQGKAVVLVGQRTDEAPALIGVDVWDGSLSEIINIISAGRNMANNIRCFLQPVLITSISGNLLNFIQIAAWGDASLTTVQSVYVNSAALFLGGLALLTKESEDNPMTCGSSLVSAHMTINIVMQVSYQLTCLLIIQTKGSRVMGSSQNMKAVLSNIFIICQFFNLFNARELHKKNFFRSIHRHITFWSAITVFVVLHATLVAAQVIFGYASRLNWKLWSVCVLFGLLSWLVDWIAKCISWFINKFVNSVG